MDFVRKSVRAIGRCAIKVEQAAERCVSTLLDLIQTKVNYVVQEAIVVIKVRVRQRCNRGSIAAHHPTHTFALLGSLLVCSQQGENTN